MTEIRTRRALVLVLSFFLLASPLFACISYAQPPPSGGWVVTGNEVVANQIITLNRNLTIMSGGNLTLNGVTLTMNNQYNGQYGISVQPGGSLHIYNSDITAGNLANRYTFVVNGNNFVMEGSQVQGVGSCDNINVGTLAGCLPFGEENHQFTVTTAMVMETDDALIENNVFSQNAIGLIVGGSSVTVIGNTFQSNDYSAFGLVDSSNDLITNNTFEQNATANLQLWIVSLGNANDSLIEYNTLLTGNLPGVPTQSRCDGLDIMLSDDNIITHNNITAENAAVILGDNVDAASSNNTVSGNILVGGEDGIVGIIAVDSTIESNMITGDSPAIVLELAHGSVVANNSISGDMALGIQVDHTSNSTILNNNITMGQYGQEALYLSSSNNDVVAGNDLSGALQGILIYDSSDNGTIYDNQVGASYSIVIEGSSLNRIYQNNFYDLSPPVGGPSDNGNNSWSLGTIGNYWSYYTPANLNSCDYNFPSCFVGGATYNRTSVPPNGTELYSEQTPFTVYQVPITQPQFVTFPITSEPAVVPGNVIVNQVVQMDSGHLPNGQDNLTIVNSTLILGSEGEVTLGGGPNLTIDIENSKILDAGYGSLIALFSLSTSLEIVNSTLDGVQIQDLSANNITVENSIISNPLLGYGITIASANYVTIVNNSLSYDYVGIRTSCSQENSGSVIVSGNTVLCPAGSGIIVNACPASNPYTLVSGNIVVGGGIAVSVNATIAGNIISDSHTLLMVNQFFDSLIVNNTFSNSFGGIQFYQCADDLVYHNNFINDSAFPILSSLPNTWDYNGQGK